VRVRSLQGRRRGSADRRRHDNRRRAALLPALLLAFVACTDPAARPSGGPTPAPPVSLKIAFLENLTPEGAFERVVPAFYGAKLALDQALASGNLPIEMEIVPQDIGDPAGMTEVLAEDAADPSYIGAMVSPFWSEPSSVGERLSDAGIPSISLSAVNPDASSWRSWYAAVAPLEDQGADVAERLAAANGRRKGVCVASDGSAYGTTFAGAVARSRAIRVVERATIPSEQVMPAPVMREIRSSGCGTLAFGGFGSDAGLIRIELDAAGLSRVGLVGSDAILDHTFLEITGASGDGTIASCSCADLGASPDLPGQQFIHDFQSEYGASPPAYAVEGWDVARMFASAVRSGARTRSSVADAISAEDSFDGLAHDYAFTRSGELAPASRAVAIDTAEGGRWLPVGGSRH
jgi:branched-chain amino acid transport system substrate-binding protein